MDNFKDALNEMATKRCENIIKNIDIDILNNDKSYILLKSLRKMLSSEQIVLLDNYIEECNFVNSIYEEQIYLAGFKDGICFGDVK